MKINEQLKYANKLFRSGNFQEALGYYYGLRARNYLSPDLDSILQNNIERCEKLIYSINGNDRITLNDFVKNISSRHNLDSSLLNDMESLPLVSVIVTTHNDKENLPRSLNSLLNQIYVNLEIIVVDDASDDGTNEMMVEYVKKYSNVHYYRLSCNLGTYFAKNYGIQQSHGDYLFFQDSDDISHRHRIFICMEKFLKHDTLKVVNCEYSRFDVDNMIIRVNYALSRFGRITLGIRRSVISDIGYFNCTTKASDDEFYRRLVRCYNGTDFICGVNDSLYYALYRENSLFSDMVESSANNNILQKIDSDRQAYVSAFNKIHLEIPCEDYASYFSFPRIFDAIPVAKSFSRLANPNYSVMLGIFIGVDVNWNLVKQAINLLKLQCDRMIVFYAEENTRMPELRNVDVLKYRPELCRRDIKEIISGLFQGEFPEFYWISFKLGENSLIDYVNCQLKKIIKIKSNNAQKIDELSCHSDFLNG